ncbi:MAG: L-histidine N(alpha)-methyltransferase [Patescibacteria group bacterium]|nr:L-histidine N(alpha)-methyltransferase [Patescibacteria group bacterium]MDD4304559.1 L-histidine N(alpha)-methyltransferase [Patescibacteria group bacterium]MDD4695746.1 L-histidine N(alpha)-methyltransferase [Patescibacteria group bacterium]
MKPKIHSLISDSELDVGLLDDLKDRILDQKHFYTGELAANLYYKNKFAKKTYFKNSLGMNNYINFFNKNVPIKQENTALISLGCGDSDFEKIILDSLEIEGSNFSYIGVDSSRYMLELSAKKLEKSKFKNSLVCGDFSSHNFRSEIGYLINDYKNKVFGLLGGTIGNIIPTNIVDTLGNMLNKGDYLWVTLVLREGLDEEHNFEIFNYYAQYLNDSAVSQFKFNPLKKLKVPYENGKLVLEMQKEDFIGALKFIFSFEFTKKTVISFRDEKIIILPGEKIELLNNRAYDMNIFKKFFIEHDFKCVAEESKGRRGQILLMKK